MERSTPQLSTVDPGSVYSLPPRPYRAEDILFCVDLDAESRVEMKSNSTRLECIKQAILLFVNSKLQINRDHRFSFSSLTQSVNWVRKEFSNQIGRALAAVNELKASESSYGVADITQLFRMASQEAKRSKEQGRIFRVILIYCRSSTRPQHQWPIFPKNFTLDVIYLHDKPSTENCPQKVYDCLVDALEHVTEYEGYIYENGTGHFRLLIRQLCTLLSHPEQRCIQDDVDIPKSVTRKLPPQSHSALATSEDSGPSPIQ